MKKCIKIVILVVLVTALGVSLFQSRHSSDWKKISPFTDVKFDAGKIIAEYEGTSYEVSSIEGISSRQLIIASKLNFGHRWQKRIREDIAEVLVAAGAPESTSVALELKELKTGVLKTVSNAEMTKENRSQIYRNTQG